MTVDLTDSRIHYSETSGDKLPIRAAGTELSIVNVVPAIPPTQTEIQVSKFGVVFHTLDKNKDHDTWITLQIGDVTVWQMPQTGGIAREFAEGHDDPYPFSFTTSVTNLVGKTLKVCIQPNGNNTWHFNMRLYASRSDSGDYTQADTVRNCVFNSPDLKCYISDHNDVTLDQDHRCTGAWVLLWHRRELTTSLISYLTSSRNI